MGPGVSATQKDVENAYLLGKMIATAGWVTLSGGRHIGVMEAVSRGAFDHHGLTIGILPEDDERSVSAYVQIPIITGMGSARNNINVLTSQVVVACGLGAGTVSEIALALKANKPVILLGLAEEDIIFLRKLGNKGEVEVANSPEEVVQQIREKLNLKQF